MSQEYIDKKWPIRLLHQPLDKIKGLTEAQLAAVFSIHPLAASITGIVNEIKHALKSKKPHNLLSWMEKAALLNLHS